MDARTQKMVEMYRHGVTLQKIGDQRLTFGQVLRLMQFCECYDPLMYLCDETLHARPDRKSAQDEEVHLAEVINSAAATMERAMKALDHIKARGGIRAVA